MIDDLNDKNLKAPLPSSAGKPEITDGANWFTLATENWVQNTISNVPKTATASAIICPRHNSSNPARCAKPGALIFIR